MREINFLPSLRIIEKGTFKGCQRLEDLIIPSTVSSIGEEAFFECLSLKELVIPKSVKRIGDGVFSACDLDLKIESPLFFSDGFCLINLNSGRLLCCHKKDLKQYSIPRFVTSIGKAAFIDCQSLESIEIPQTVTTIGKEAFSNCWSPRSIVIPERVQIIAEKTFYKCTSLESITLGESLESIGG